MTTKKTPKSNAKKSDNIQVSIPRNNAASAAAGAVVGGIVAGPMGAVIGGVVGGLIPGNTDKISKAVKSGANTVSHSSGMKKVTAMAKKMTAKGERTVGKITSSTKKVVKTSGIKVTVPKKSAARPAPKAKAKKAPAPKKSPAKKSAKKR